MVVLYRKYRPKNFSEIIGQEHIVKTLSNAISMGVISHAYLFYGPRGTGKTTVARLLAKAINCRNRKEKEFEPCNRCISCQEINEGRAIDLIEIDAASNRGIEEIRNLKEGINIVPTKSKYKVYILDEAHQLTKEASNALLKTLEEPPGHAIFVLCTTEYQKVLPTIASRCQQFEFKKLTIPQITKKLEEICKKEGARAEKEALELIAKTADGALRDAESLLDEVFSLEDKEIKKEEVEKILGIVGIGPISKLVDFLSKKDKKGAVEYLQELQAKGVDIENFSKKIVSYLNDLLLVKINPNIFAKNSNFTKEEEESLKKQEKNFSEEDLKECLKIFLEAQNQIKWSDLPQLPLELAAMDAIEQLTTNN
jgi:DNA polymerase-3 subunit gamma/tau